jgi:hypothetical protein
MFADVTWDKVVYDVLMALLTGVFAGLLVDFALRRREKARSLRVMQLIRGELLTLTDEFLLQTVPAECRVVSPRWCILAPNLEIYVTMEAADSSMYEDGTNANRALWEAAKSNLPNMENVELTRALFKESRESVPRRIPENIIEPLTITKTNVDSIYQRYGLHLDLEYSALLSRLYSGLSRAIDYSSPAFAKEQDELIQSAFVSALVVAWCAAYQIHSATSREGLTLSTTEHLSRVTQGSRDALRHLSDRYGINLPPPSGKAL